MDFRPTGLWPILSDSLVEGVSGASQNVIHANLFSNLNINNMHQDLDPFQLKQLLINLLPSCPEAFEVDRAVRGEVDRHDVAGAHL